MVVYATAVGRILGCQGDKVLGLSITLQACPKSHQNLGNVPNVDAIQ